MKHFLGSSHCNCGKVHDSAIDELIVGKGAVNRLPEFVQKYGAKKVFLLADKNTFAAAGETVCNVLNKQEIAFVQYVMQEDNLEPDEKAVGSVIMHFDTSCDLIIGIGSGVINDLGKILSNISGRKYIIVGTATSMDGYASSTSSMAMDGLKVSLDSTCADVIIGDTDILKSAPEHMLKAGLGDMLAKYVSIAEWRISHLINGEYYCENIAQLIRSALKKCVDNADGLLRRDEQAIEAVFEGLAISGIAMAYAGMSRPAAGVEHYFSHIWDMRGLEFGTPIDLHGIQCAWGTFLSVKLYEKMKTIKPNKEKAIAAVNAFEFDKWSDELREFLGSSAEPMISKEYKDKKYDKQRHLARIEYICDHWDDILRIINEELPSYQELSALLDVIGIEKAPVAIGVSGEALRLSFKATKDIRDKYVLSRLAWDLGELENLCEIL